MAPPRSAFGASTRAAAWLGTLFAAALLAGCATPPPTGPVKVTVLAINDFHGHLKTPPGGVTNAVRRTPARAGGVAHLATAVAEAKARNPHHVFVAAGDLIGATPLLSALLHDEPTIEALSAAGLEASAIGNHELDRGSAELLRLQQGGCHPKDGCRGSQPYRGAGFRYLAANTIVADSGRTLLPPYWVKRFQGLPVAFVGLTLKGTPEVVTPAGVAGLRFADEADTVNALVPELQRQGIEAIVVLMHEGGYPTGDFNECPGISGPVVEIVKRFHKAVDVVISGHTHRAYNCRIDGRVVTSADRYGTILTQIDLTLDPKSRDVTAAEAENLLVAPERFAPHPQVSALVEGFERIVAPLAKRPVTRLAAVLPANVNAAGESAAGRTIADAQLEATRRFGAQFALMNIGGVRGPIGRDERLDVTYEDLFAVQPFSNHLVTMTLSGAQVLQLLEQQWSGGSGRGRVMQVSANFGYTWDLRRPEGQRVVPGSVHLDGRPLDPNAEVRVTVNSFMADGGDGFTVLRQGRDRSGAGFDLEALETYLKARPGYAQETSPRITRLN